MTETEQAFVELLQSQVAHLQEKNAELTRQVQAVEAERDRYYEQLQHQYQKVSQGFGSYYDLKGQVGVSLTKLKEALAILEKAV